MGPRSLITGSSTWKTRADFLSQSLLRQSQQTNISQAASRWKMKRVKIGRAAARPDRKLLKLGLACECRSVHALRGVEAMSALGQKRTCAVHHLMSALPPKADMCGATRDVRFVPIADMGACPRSQIFETPCFTRAWPAPRTAWLRQRQT